MPTTIKCGDLLAEMNIKVTSPPPRNSLISSLNAGEPITPDNVNRAMKFVGRTDAIHQLLDHVTYQYRLFNKSASIISHDEYVKQHKFIICSGAPGQ